jgi:hypothetical protein
MNDTEAEARRLLAAATEDMPPGIDLLAGFAAARRRDRARRRRARAVLAAAVVVAAASAAAVALTIGSAPPARAALISALTRTLAQSYHLTQTTRSYYISSGGQITNRSQLVCTIQADPVRQLEASSCANGLAFRQVGRYVYLHFTALAGDPGKHWQRFPAGSVGGLPGADGLINATPQQMLSQIKEANKVTVIGPVSGPGWTGTRYAFASRQATLLRLSGTVDVDQQGQARALVLTMRSGTIYHLVMTQVLTFSDFGTPVTVTPPPADQTIDMCQALRPAPLGC